MDVPTRDESSLGSAPELAAGDAADRAGGGPSHLSCYITVGLFLLLGLLAYDERVGLVTDVLEGRVASLTPGLRGDAEHYYHELLELPLPCVTVKRPPLFYITGRLGLLLAGDTSLSPRDPARPLKDYPPDFVQKTLRNQRVVRMVTVWQSMAALLAIFLLGLLMGGPTAGIVCAALWAFFAWEVYYSVCFLRTNLVSVLNITISALFILLLRTSADAAKRRWGLAAAIAATLVLSALTRLVYLTAAVQLLVAYNLALLAARRWSRRELVLSASIACAIAVLLSPYLIYNRVNTGSFTPALNSNAVWWASHEFVGQPGFPTREQLGRKEYLTRNVTSYEYIFGMHTLPEVATRFVKGYAKAFFDDLPRRTSFVFMTTVRHAPWLMLLVPLGIAVSFVRRGEGLFLFLAMLIFMLPFAFIMTVNYVLPENPADTGTGVEARFIMPLFPFAFLYCALAIDWIRRQVCRRIAPALVESGPAEDSPPVTDADADTESSERQDTERTEATA